MILPSLLGLNLKYYKTNCNIKNAEKNKGDIKEVTCKYIDYFLMHHRVKCNVELVMSSN